ncbi:hypothetical protein JXR93_06185 [bacterium]|nr:hypothetical protein [bacterium]
MYQGIKKNSENNSNIDENKDSFELSEKKDLLENPSQNKSERRILSIVAIWGIFFLPLITIFTILSDPPITIFITVYFFHIILSIASFISIFVIGRKKFSKKIFWKFLLFINFIIFTVGFPTLILFALQGLAYAKV